MVAPIATGDKPTYDITLTDVPSGGTTTVGIMLADGSSPQAIRRLPRGPGVKRLDVEQRDWTGGRGNENRFALDSTKVYDQKNIWGMTPGQLTPAPLMRFPGGGATGYDTLNVASKRAYQQWIG